MEEGMSFREFHENYSKAMGAIPMTFEEFCKVLKVQPDHYMFSDMKDPVFYRFEDHVEWNQLRSRRPTQYYFYNGKGVIREFKFMPQYAEIWTRTFTQDQGWSLGGTWKQCDDYEGE